MAGKIPVFLCSLLLAAPAVSMAQSNMTVYSDCTVNAGQPIRTADPRWFGIGTPIWDNYLDTPQTLTLLTNMGAQALRFPGGSVADQFHWFNNVNDAGNPPFYVWSQPWPILFKWLPT